MVERGLEAHTPGAAAPIVECKDDIAVLCQVLPKETLAAAGVGTPGIAHELVSRAAIHIDYDRIAASRLEIPRLEHLVVESLTVLGRECPEFCRHLIG